MTIFDGSHSEYLTGKLDLKSLNADPFLQLRQWLEDARDANVIEPNAMSLATSDAHNIPSVRMVLLKELDSGIVFCTNYLSRKGSDLSENKHAAVCFWWGALQRQIRIEGTVEKVSDADSDHYFAARPRESQATSASSPQSQIISSRKELEVRVKELLEREPIDRPDHWGGYRLVPSYFEFWQGRKARLHDRLCYVKQGEDWVIHRLAP